APPHDPPASSGEAHARDAVKHGEGHETQPMANEIWWKWANFAVLALGLGYLIGKNAPGFFRGRSESIQKEISEASAGRQEAEARAAALEKQIANLSAEVEGLKAKSREEITREGERIQAESRAQIEKVQRQAEADIASAAKNAAQELKAHSAELAVQLAARQIENRMTEQVQENLTDGFIEDVRRKAALN
ncbi:MAG TPA: ATP synthase F0 subunit B, partial [Bryobacteraceae bacterium]|nr:ATP synthase F0 subunit B [Bryobacteraceae bacterium]